MKTSSKLFRVSCLMILSWLLAGTAGDLAVAKAIRSYESGQTIHTQSTSLEAPANRQSGHPLRLTFTGLSSGPPEVEVLDDGTVVFRITAIESVSGDLTGALTESITQVHHVSEVNGLLPVTTIWKLETAEGTIQGYYSGLFDHLQDGSHRITQHGEVLSVTGAYANLYQARVLFTATLGADHQTIAGNITIQPRGRR